MTTVEPQPRSTKPKTLSDLEIEYRQVGQRIRDVPDDTSKLSKPEIEKARANLERLGGEAVQLKRQIESMGGSIIEEPKFHYEVPEQYRKEIINR